MNSIFYYFVLPNSSETYCKLRYIDMLTLHNRYFSDYMLQWSQSTLVLLVVLLTNFSTWYIYFYLTEDCKYIVELFIWFLCIVI